MNLYVHTNEKIFLEEKGEVCCRYVEEREFLHGSHVET
jgi:hypothetical protein